MSKTSSFSAWAPSATLDTLKARALLMRELRGFFFDRDVLEVDVPLLSRATVTDPNIESIQAICNQEPVFLQTSPEFFLKRLLSAGVGSLYYLGKAFRDGEAGRRHNPEFTMLEWYRVGWTAEELMNEVAALLRVVLGAMPVTTKRYGQVFLEALGVNPHEQDSIRLLASLKAVAKEKLSVSFDDNDPNVWMELLFSHCIEPNLKGITLIYDFPASQAALAKIDRNDHGEPVACRFEAYVDGIELANGYWELTDSQEQARRFEKDLHRRQSTGAYLPPVDKHLLHALQAGMPECAGVALGVDRLLMLKRGVKNIADVVAFDFSRC
ncbi:EF-P lysine aminoacylase EpmA [Marinibactrum halimedae]|uniref:Elongation factor P--(R)-beta-lysine ligase n=1 Tax=Marinibactrum halimedae TaxID=1444977 RepID=A0AA37SZX8_9GAMM|nr:EF-P lysine aminoacylase EpmA [Marinibactrum halimedae]MCD9460258.1 EF-P lysine aminoacylase GenX [Marinibactrum halimedae]GLS24344.1 elongation factor P--(R)-beta-lysine ligase [Marinibactrum halimedae]